jgi:hypothetical protein
VFVFVSPFSSFEPSFFSLIPDLFFSQLMRLTFRPRNKPKPKPQYPHLQKLLERHRQETMSVIPSAPTSTTPLSPTITQSRSLVTTPVPSTPVPTTTPPAPQFYSAPHPGLPPPGIEPLSFSPPTTTVASNSIPRPATQNDILKRIIKTDGDGGIKKKQRPANNAHHFKSVKGNIVPPPPLSKYKRPPPIIPNRPGERYPLGIP